MKNLDYLSADLNAKRAMENMDITAIPYPNNHFDVAISLDVLDDVDDDIKAISELYRIQEKNGWSVHLVPIDYSLDTTIEDSSITDPNERLKYFGAYENKRKYGLDYKDRLTSMGFNVEIYNIKSFCSEKEIEMMDLRNYNIYYLTK